MAYGKEIHFGVVGPDAVFDLAQKLKIELVDLNSDSTSPLTKQEFIANGSQCYIDFDRSDRVLEIDVLLEQAYISTLTTLGWEFVQTGDYFKVQTPWGLRKASSFGFYPLFDPDEMGEEPKDISLGIKLSSRYFPCIMDMEESHGTLHTIVLDKTFYDRIEICKQEIIKVLPEFSDALIYIREQFY